MRRAVPGQWHLSHQRAHQLRLCAAGVNCALAQTLGLRNIRPFGPEDKEKPWYSIIVFVPKSHAEAVYRTMSEAGAGRQGNYSGCAYMNDGEGRFLPEAGAHPYLGKVGALEKGRGDPAGDAVCPGMPGRRYSGDAGGPPL